MSVTILVNVRFNNESRQIELSQNDTVSKINKEFDVSDAWYNAVYNGQILKQDDLVEETELQDLCEVDLIETEAYKFFSKMILEGALQKFPLNKKFDSNDKEKLELVVKYANEYTKTRDPKYLKGIAMLATCGVDINTTFPE